MYEAGRSWSTVRRGCSSHHSHTGARQEGSGSCRIRALSSPGRVVASWLLPQACGLQAREGLESLLYGGEASELLRQSANLLPSDFTLGKLTLASCRHLEQADASRCLDVPTRSWNAPHESGGIRASDSSRCLEMPRNGTLLCRAVPHVAVGLRAAQVRAQHPCVVSARERLWSEGVSPTQRADRVRDSRVSAFRRRAGWIDPIGMSWCWTESCRRAGPA